MAEIWKVIGTYSVWVHTGPGTSYPHSGVLYGKDNKEYTVTERKNTYWLNIGSGWACECDWNGLRVMTKVRDSNPPKPVEPDPTYENVEEEELAWVPDTDPIIISSSEFASSLDQTLRIKNLRGIFGMPYQFLPSVDTRVGTTNDAIGRKYGEMIVAKMPLLLMTPGTPVFMAKFTEKQKANILEKFISFSTGEEGSLDELIDREGKYYSLKYAYNDYFKYVNPMCRAAARFLNIQDETIDGVKLDEYNWAWNTNENVQQFLSAYRGCLAFYINSDTQVSEDFSNSTTESQLASKVNGLSDYGREINYLLGSATSGTALGSVYDKFVNQEELSNNIENLNNFINNTLLGRGQIFSNITSNIQTVVAGGRLIFPEIWSESSFARSYSINMKFTSPDCDKLSIYLNILVPLYHLIGLAAPRQVKSNGYISPFLVRAFYKGLFNVDMGIITSLSVTKGAEGAWTKDGLPTVVDVAITLKDLYSDMAITSSDDIKLNFMNNIILMDYIANSCGVNINEPDIMRSIDMFFTQNIINRVSDTVHLDIFGTLDQWVTNKWLNIFGGL